MKYEAAQLLTEMNGTGEIYGDYKGRGQWEETTAITFKTQIDFIRAIAAIMENGSSSERKLVATELRYIKSDSLGTSIIYY